MTGLIDLETEPIARAVVAELLRSWLRLHSNLEARSSDDWRASWVGVTTHLRCAQRWAQPTSFNALTGLGSKEEVAYCVRHGLMAALLIARRLIWECYPALVEARASVEKDPEIEGYTKIVLELVVSGEVDETLECERVFRRRMRAELPAHHSHFVVVYNLVSR